MEGLSIDLLEGMESLLNKSLIQQEVGSQTVPRFFFLESIHEYAREQLEQFQVADQFRKRHAEYFSSFAEKAEPEVFKDEQAEWFSRINSEKDNLRTAINWAYDHDYPELSLRIISALWQYWYNRGQFTEVMTWINRGLIHAETIPASLHVKVLNTAAYFAFTTGNYENEFGEKAIHIAREGGDKKNLAWALFNKGLNLTAFPEMHIEGTKYCMEALLLFKELDDQPGISIAYNALGEFSRMNGDYEEAELLYQKGVQSSSEYGDLHRKSILLGNLSQIAFYHGDYDNAEKYALEEISICRDIKNNSSLAASLAVFAGPISVRGDPERAARLMSASINLYEIMGGNVQPADQPMLDLILRSIKDQLDEASFQSAWEEGKTLTLEEAYALAMGKDN
jgi:non-specific serine/threonine protein kinase